MDPVTSDIGVLIYFTEQTLRILKKLKKKLPSSFEYATDDEDVQQSMEEEDGVEEVEEGAWALVNLCEPHGRSRTYCIRRSRLR